MYITGTHIAYLHLCHRKLWLFANGINMEHGSELVGEGKFIDETTYQQRAKKWRQLSIEGIKVDYFDPRSGILREVKKSSKREVSHIAQVKYYMFVMERNGIGVSRGLLEYPRLQQTEEVWLDDTDREEIPVWEENARKIITSGRCPEAIRISLCRHCAYYEFCWIAAEESISE